MSDMLGRPKPRDAFKRALRARLMAQASVVLVQRESTWSRFQRSWLKPAVAFAAVTLLVAAGTGKAAADSLPGDLTFGLKTAAEQLQLALALDDTSRLQVLAHAADHRLAELSQAVATRPDAVPTATDEYAAAVARFTAAVDALRGKPDASTDKRIEAEDVVDAAHEKHEAVLDDLEKSAPDGSKGDVERAKREADKLHPSDRPARTPEPSDDPDQDQSPQPARTVEPVRTTEPARASETPRAGDTTRTTPRPTTRP
jgi:uncharacterized protein DUF5667